MKEIIVNSKKHGTHAIIVDDEDYEYINQFRWSVYKAHHGIFYANTKLPIDENKKQKTVLMHRIIMKADNSKIFVDHIDHNGLNNQKKNLRLCSNSQNRANTRVDSINTLNSTSKYKGVSWFKRDLKWIVYIKAEGKNKYLGLFLNEIDGAKAYNKAALKYYREFACLNLLESETL